MKKWLKRLNSTPFGMKPTEAKRKAPAEAELAARASRSANAGPFALRQALLP